MTELEQILLEKLSFFDETALDQIVLRFNDVELQKIGNQNLNDIYLILGHLEKKGKISIVKKNDQLFFKRINPNRISWYQKLYYLVKYFLKGNTIK